MSSGDIDDTLGSLTLLRYYMETNNAFREYILKSDSLSILRASIPYGAGISEDGEIRYIDHRINTFFRGVDVSPALARHESTEWALRKFCNVGVDYDTDPTGHRIANSAEMEKVLSLLQDNKSGYELWQEYDDFIDGQIRVIEKGELTNVPADLALYPYEGDRRLLERIKEAQAQGPDSIVEGEKSGEGKGE